MKTETLKQIFTGLVLGAAMILTPAARGGNPELPLDLQSADDFVILGKSGISTVPPSNITGDMGVSPITSTAITGFALIMDSSGEFSTSAQVTGKIYAPDYMPPTPVKMTTAISDMETAYTTAAGRTLPDTNNLGATAGGDKDIGGLTFAPGLHKWTTGVLVSTNVTLDAAGDPDAVFIFQIEGDLTIASGQSVILAGGAQAKNIFWQVAGGAGAIIGTTAHFEGVLLTANAINVLTGASFNGKLLAQKDVNLQQNTIVDSSLINQYTLTYNAGLGGSVLGDSPQLVLEGENGTMVTAVPDPGFVFVGWTGTDPSLDNPRTDLNVMADITVEAQFVPEYTLTYTAGLGGSVAGVSPQTVLEGEDGSMVTAVADPGFVFIGWTGTDPSLDNPRTDLNVMADITVEAQFVPEYTLTYTAGLGGSVSGVSPQTVREGEDGTMVTAVADPGFVFVGWTGTDPSTDNPRTDLNVMADITVEAQFQVLAPNQYVFTYTADLGGSISGNPLQIVDQGNDGTTVTAVPDPGYTFVEWVGTDPSLVNPRTDLNAVADITVQAKFQAIEYTFTYTAGTGGSISGISPQTVAQGNDGTMVTAVPDLGYSFVEWTGTHPSTDNPRTDLNAMADVTVEAQFVANPAPCGILISLGTLLENDLSGRFSGTGLTYAASSSAPAVMTASITPDNRLRTEALSTGSVEITVTATHPSQPPQVLVLAIDVVGNPTTVSSAFLPFESWNPRFTQKITVRNDETCDAVGIRLLFSNLKEGIIVENQNGTAPDPDGRVAISMKLPFASGASVDLSVVYLSTGAFRADHYPPTMEVQFIMADTPPSPGGQRPLISRIQSMDDGRVFLEFASVPGTHYQIEYMNDFPNGDWQTVALDLLAGGNLTQWIDQGPPATAPLSGVRVYRVREVAP